MEGKFRSINFKVWRIMAIVIIIFFGAILTINYTVIRTMKSAFVLERLKETSGLIKDYENISSIENKYIGLPQALNFKIIQEEDGYDISIDPFIMEIAKKKDRNINIFQKITSNIEKNKEEKGRLKE
ncbi:MAG: hypothetical protein Q7K48_02960, partial [Fusobacterium sp. JB021]|nr:hypothetical protein [Fusobacterium sp. JB021]